MKDRQKEGFLLTHCPAMLSWKNKAVLEFIVNLQIQTHWRSLQKALYSCVSLKEHSPPESFVHLQIYMLVINESGGVIPACNGVLAKQNRAIGLFAVSGLVAPS